MAIIRICDVCSVKLRDDEPLGMARISIITDVNELHLDACGPCLTKLADLLREISCVPDVRKAIFQFQTGAEAKAPQQEQEF